MLRDILQQPVPDMTELRVAKKTYRSYPLVLGEHNTEPLVDIAEYGIAGQSYYSRRNAATGEPLTQASTTVLLRQSVAERLADINYALQQSADVKDLLGGEVELYVDEGALVRSANKIIRKYFSDAHSPAKSYLD